ncbi:MAG: hypothetical protein ACFCGT_01070 [Sandaracinaceae bacterium]
MQFFLSRRGWSVGGLALMAMGVAGAMMGCAGPAPSLLDAPLGPFPERLVDVGLYPDPADRTTVDERALGFEPEHPLWSNGSAKERYLVVPEGGAIDASDPEAWAFPVGTLAFKTFTYAEDGGERPVETRVIRRRADGWGYAVYRWNDSGTEASLLDLSLSVAVPVTVDGESFEHAIPSRVECQTCHEAGATLPLGLRGVQLSGADGPLSRWSEAGVFAAPIEDPQTIDHPDPDTRWVLSYFQGNCVHCHRDGGAIALDLSLEHEVALERIIDQPTRAISFPNGIRVVPGAPAESLLFLAVSGEGDAAFRPMPPLGVQRRDAPAVERLRAWIGSLEP